jgi:hypothetical protein
MKKGVTGNPQYRFSTEYGKELSEKTQKRTKE